MVAIIDLEAPTSVLVSFLGRIYIISVTIL